MFEANCDLEAGAELHFNYFLHLNERNIAATEKQFRSCAVVRAGPRNSRVPSIMILRVLRMRFGWRMGQ